MLPAGAPLAQGEQAAEARIGRPVGGPAQERGAAGEVEPAADDEAEGADGGGEWRPPAGTGDVAATDADCETTLIGEQSLDALWTAVRALPWPFREALVLVDLQERPYDEAARIAGVELNTLRTRLFRARQRLALALRPGPRTPP